MKLPHRLAAAAIFLAAAAPALGQTATIRIENPWSRATPAGATNGAVYLTVENASDGEDRLTGASSDLAARTEIHEMNMANGVMKMREVADGLAVPGHGAVTLRPGGYHVMLIGLKNPLRAGETVALTLDFANAGKIGVSAPVLGMTSAGPKADGMKMH